jgi:hypothetical protein
VSNIDNVSDPWDCRPWFDKVLSGSSRRREWVTFFEPMLKLKSAEEQEAIARMNPPWRDNEAFLAQAIDSLIANTAWSTYLFGLRRNDRGAFSERQFASHHC